jgi:hypothetical protein
VAGLFYSSFGTHPAGLRDALATYLPMTGRVSGAPAGHEKPWWYYGSLFWRQTQGGYVWDQTPFLVLALAGAILALRRGDRGFRAVLLYGVGLVVALSAVAYKTPWIVIHLVPPLCGLAALLPAWGLQRAGWWRGWGALAVVGVVAWQLGQVRQAVFRRPADPRNPFAYVHSSPDVKKASGLLSAAGAGVVRVISEDYWPLPWYLRTGTNVGYWIQPPANCDGALLFVSPASGRHRARAAAGPLRGKLSRIAAGGFAARVSARAGHAVTRFLGSPRGAAGNAMDSKEHAHAERAELLTVLLQFELLGPVGLRIDHLPALPAETEPVGGIGHPVFA